MLHGAFVPHSRMKHGIITIITILPGIKSMKGDPIFFNLLLLLKLIASFIVHRLL